MAKIRITKEFTFELAHALWNYDGPCKNIHGHSYRLFVTVIGEPKKNDENPKCGMVIDFTDLKKIVKDNIVALFDHSVIINRKAPVDYLRKVEQMFNKYYVVDYQPTSENIVVDIANKLRDELPPEVELHSLKLFETTTSCAEWHASDNP
jgi:6-pyruvoyltetrahydropterin/6-carboxytetrahydropterin synthase